ncbi:hypothetical protein ACFV1B_24190 [Streptomyces sp. NPDC059637]|uniref:hypothetical protein n=1 Tax=Streptomyces sp. NPDC059637 TaxID=3347752 RepID=UPI0036B7F6E0
MITELAVERVEFTCGHCWTRWSADYDVQHYQDDRGADWEYFSRDGVPVASPYTPEGAPACPLCGRHWVGRLQARRPVPVPGGDGRAPRSPVTDAAGHRPERRTAPLLGAAAHEQPGSTAGPAAAPAAGPSPARP